MSVTRFARMNRNEAMINTARKLGGQAVQLPAYKMKHSQPLPRTSMRSPIPLTLHQRECRVRQFSPLHVIHSRAHLHTAPVLTGVGGASSSDPAYSGSGSLQAGSENRAPEAGRECALLHAPAQKPTTPSRPYPPGLLPLNVRLALGSREKRESVHLKFELIIDLYTPAQHRSIKAHAGSAVATTLISTPTPALLVEP